MITIRADMFLFCLVWCFSAGWVLCWVFDLVIDVFKDMTL